jgi:MFS family permease
VSTFTDPRERGRAFGVFGSVAAGGSAVGLVLGGALTEDLSWRWCLYVNLIFAAIAVAGALVYMRGMRPLSRPRMDWIGAALGCAAPLAIVFGFSYAESAGWTAALTLGSLVCGVVLLVGFAVAELYVPHPLLPLWVIVDRARGGAYVAVGISGMAIFGTFLFLTFYLQVVKGYSPLTTGLLFLPMTLCILISSNLSNNIGLGPRALIAAGMLLSAVGMALLTQVSITSSYVGGVLPALLILGFRLGLIFVQAINTATAGVAREDSGVASALVNTMQQVGGSIGTAALSTIALSATATYLIGHDTGPQASVIADTFGYTVAFGVSPVLLGVGFILAIVLVPSRGRLAELRNADAVAPAAVGATPTLAPPKATAAPREQSPCESIPVALCSCSPLIHPFTGSSAITAMSSVQDPPGRGDGCGGDDLPDIIHFPGGLNAFVGAAGTANLPQFLQTRSADLTPYLAGDAIKDYPFLAAIPTYAWANSGSAVEGHLSWACRCQRMVSCWPAVAGMGR